MTIRRQHLEARVIPLVDVVVAGGRVEDHLVECKAAWPDPGRRQVARQLAGHANRARGEPILWLIGLDEDVHGVTHPEPVDVASWWAAVAKWFDGAVPDLTDLVVHVGERQAVHAMYFTTDLPPYVITGGGENGALEREVPIRDGTRTRSARRDELLRLLIPAVAPPATQVLSATVQLSRGGSTSGSRPPYAELWLNARVFFEQPGTPTGIITLPRHLMRGRVDIPGSGSDPILLSLGYDDSPHVQPSVPNLRGMENVPIVLPRPPVTHGVDPRRDAVVVTGPGALSLRSHIRLESDVVPLVLKDLPVEVRLSFGVAGIDRLIQLEMQLEPEPGKAEEEHRLGWKLVIGDYDPWAVAEP
jgi:hypothetical protein